MFSFDFLRDSEKYDLFLCISFFHNFSLFFHLLFVIFKIGTFREHDQGCTVKLELPALSLHVYEYLQVCAVLLHTNIPCFFVASLL